MPSLGADMEAGTLVEKLIADGGTIKSGDVIGAVETQKGVIEMEAFEDGILEHWLVELGARVPVGTPLAVIRAPGDTAQEIPDQPEPTTPEPPPPEQPVPDEPVTPPPTPEYEPPTDPTPQPPEPELAPKPRPPLRPAQAGTAARVGEPRVRATPAARRLAAQRGIDIGAVPAGPDGVVARANVAAVTPTKPAQTDMRAAIAAAMSRSKKDIPHYYLSHRLDLTAADAFLSDLNAHRPPDGRVLLGALCAKAIATTLGKYREFNGHFTDGRFRPADKVHLGMAINIRGGGLVAPALFDAGFKPLDALMAELRDLVTRVRAGRFRARELSDATITLSSLGDRGVDRLYGVIYPPQVAILGLGTPRLHPAIHDRAVAARLCATMTLAADHRVSDGHRGALFLRAIDTALQTPETLRQ